MLQVQQIISVLTMPAKEPTPMLDNQCRVAEMAFIKTL
jgi:hypothetical protein